ncbi:MAG: undecaprenyl-phosphate glucose phosphotransferase [Candidatus Sericytochromatia bacterium]|nr:undecaprenyl-phosphate glucose phosphotransferase [Candidatus Sericytochromatia bacterium]
MAHQWLVHATGAVPTAPVARPWWDGVRRRTFAWALPGVLAMDLLLGFGALMLAYGARFIWKIVWGVPIAPPIEPYLWGSLAVSAVWMVAMALGGMYRDRRGAGHFEDVVLLSVALTLGTLLILAASFFYRDFSFSRIWVVMGTTVAWVVLAAWHAVARRAYRFLMRRGWGAMNTLVVGCNSLAETVGTRLYRHPELGHRLVGFVPGPEDAIEGDRWTFPAWNRTGGEQAGWGHILGPMEQLGLVVARHRIDEVVFALPGASFRDLFGWMAQCSVVEPTIRFRIVPDLTELVTAKLVIGELDGVPTLEIRDVPLRKWHHRFVKRTTDIVLSASALLLLSPLFLLLATLVKLTPGPIFYAQERMGRDGRLFSIYKFRSMRMDSEDRTGPVWARPDDNRVTRVGRVLRRFSLDELPQLWNVLRGDMSLVGPRPERPYFVDRFRQEIPKYMDRHLVRSGLTGWAQINGLRGEEGSIEERTRYDIYYVENWSWLFDLKIMLRTLYEVVAHKAY